MFSYSDLKRALYAFECLLGVLLLWLAFQLALTPSEDAIVYLLPSAILGAVGWACVMFALEAYWFRDDPDIWR